MKQIKWFDSRYYEVITDNGREYFPSVTTILSVTPKPFLANWRGNIGNEEAGALTAEAIERGNYVHSLIEHINNGGVIIYQDELEPAYRESDISNLRKYRSVKVVESQNLYIQAVRYAQLIEILKPVKILSERNVFSIKHKYAGTLDILMFLNEGTYNLPAGKVNLEGGWYVCDIKSGKTVSQDAYLQIAAYAEAVKEDKLFFDELNANGDIAGGIIIHTNAQTKKLIPGLGVHISDAIEMRNNFNDFLKVYEVYKLFPQSPPKTFDLPLMIQIKLNNEAGEAEDTAPVNELAEINQ